MQVNFLVRLSHGNLIGYYDGNAQISSSVTEDIYITTLIIENLSYQLMSDFNHKRRCK